MSNLVPFNSVANVAERGHHVMAVRGFNKDPRSAVAIASARTTVPR